MSDTEQRISRNDLRPSLMIGHLKLIQRISKSTRGNYATRKKWRVECICGRRLTVPEMYLVRQPNPKTHCGCKFATFISTHKLERSSWYMMRERCYNTTHVSYHHYGGRGIRVCDRWLNDPEGFVNFVADIGPRPSLEYSLDRIDPNGNYAPGNVRWATAKEQANNKR